ncbi:MAG: ATP-binding protein [Oscillospiraceae bacterium]
MKVKLKMRQKLTLTIFLIAAVAVCVSSAVGLVSFRQREVSAARENLNELLDLMDAQSYDTQPQAWMEQFATAAPNKRLTIISANGEVLADTAASGLADHSDRPEIEQALKEGVGEALRRSATTGKTMLYVAKVFTDGNLGRAAMPVSSLNALMWQEVAGFLLAGLLALVLAFLLSRKLAANTAKPVEDAEVATRQVGETLQNSRMEFTANVTHELKTPLTSIKGFSDMLTGGLVTDEADQKRFLTMISVETDRLIALINDVLKISELESVALPKTGDRTNVKAVAKGVAELLEPTAGDVSITVTGEDSEAEIPEGRLREVLLNLAENAVKYNKVGGSVTMEVEARGDDVVCTVTDTGLGIPVEAQPHVFERFYRVDKGRNKKQGGTGLGLAIVKHIVLLYGGEIALNSTPGVGTTVTVALPRA